MVHIIASISRFTLIIMIAIYTYDSFSALRSHISEKKIKHLFRRQSIMIYGFLINANIVLYLTLEESRVLTLMVYEMVFVFVTLTIYKIFYKSASRTLITNMCMLLSISFVMLTRLDIDKAIRQLFFAAVAVVITCFIPFLVSRFKVLDRFGIYYALIGIFGLFIVLVTASTTYGAKLSITIGSVTIQPSEFIKILFIFFSACMLKDAKDFTDIVKVTVLAAIHVLILVASKDLGGGLIYLATYLVMLYVATRKPAYLFLGTAAGAIASVVAYFLFDHVKDRVIAWLDPLSVIDDEGYQISQSLFAIGSGGWLGTGLGLGIPEKIPVVTTDFIFAAICEELGLFFAICLIFICISCFLMMFNIALQLNDFFYKLIALGIGTLYGFQTFLSLGGVTKFIPSTGVTLPLISYGGSSLLSTILLFAIIQGLYVLDQGERALNEAKKQSRT